MTCNKHAYPDRLGAETAARRARRFRDKRVHVYSCRICGAGCCAPYARRWSPAGVGGGAHSASRGRSTVGASADGAVMIRRKVADGGAVVSDLNETMIVINMSEAGRRLTVAGDPALLRRLLETIGNPAAKSAERPAEGVAITTGEDGRDMIYKEHMRKMQKCKAEQSADGSPTVLKAIGPTIGGYLMRNACVYSMRGLADAIAKEPGKTNADQLSAFVRTTKGLGPASREKIREALINNGMWND